MISIETHDRQLHPVTHLELDTRAYPIAHHRELIPDAVMRGSFVQANGKRIAGTEVRTVRVIG